MMKYLRLHVEIMLLFKELLIIDAATERSSKATYIVQKTALQL